MNIALIPARGGSRRLPRKNIRAFMGRPIISYSILTALRSGLFSSVYVSTDDGEIAAVARDYGAEVLIRTAPYARDEVGTQEVMRDAMREFPDAIRACCIYATSPLLTAEDLHDGFYALRKRVAKYAFSVGAEPLRDAGAYYWGSAHAFREGHPLIGIETVMVPLPEARVCDINIEQDWVRAERMYSELHKEPA